MAGINPSLLLNLARDNKVAELRAAVGAGLSVDFGNQVCCHLLRQCMPGPQA